MPAPALPLEPMTSDAFLEWARDYDGDAKCELIDGYVNAMAPERTRHSVVKGEAFAALRDALRSAGSSCRAYVDGPGVRIDDIKTFVPDVVIDCGPPPPGDGMVVERPVVVVEVLSPSSRSMDIVAKRRAYFTLPSVAHYLVLDPETRTVMHFTGPEGPARDVGAKLALDPPGVEVAADDLLGLRP